MMTSDKKVIFRLVFSLIKYAATLAIGFFGGTASAANGFTF